MIVHGYTKHGPIDATIEGVRMTVPDDPANRHRQMIAEWEAKGNIIPPYFPAPIPEPDPEALLREAMLEDFVDRMATNKTAPAHLKSAALAVKGRKK